MLALWGSSALQFPLSSWRIKLIKMLSKYILIIFAWVFFHKIITLCSKSVQDTCSNTQRIYSECVISVLNLESLKLKIHSTEKLDDKLATNIINCSYSNPVMSFIWPWYHHFWSFCWVMFLLLRELSITNMPGQVHIEMAQVFMSRPFSLFSETL